MHYCFSKLCLILFLSSFSIPCCYGSQRDIPGDSEDKKASKQPAKRGREELESKEQAQTQSEEKPKKQAEREIELKKRRVEENSQNLSTRNEEGEEESEEKDNIGTSESSSSEGQAKKSAEIGIWVGDQEVGVAAVQLFYNGTIISEDIIRWHREMGQQMKEIVELVGDDDSTNFIRARLDFIYKQEESYKTTAVEIPALFISGHSNKKGKMNVLKLQHDISKITTDPCIPINSYYDWVDLEENNYEGIRKKLHPLFEQAGVDDRGHPELIDSTLLEEEKKSLENLKKGAFQGWLHSEEPLVFYFSGEVPKLADDNYFKPFSEIISKIQLPKDIAPELCIISMVSRNDCCTHCRPLVLEAMQHKEFLENSILNNLESKPATLKKVLLYSAFHNFQISRPKEGYRPKVDLAEDKASVLFLMAGNNPGTSGTIE
jgi:hypothetical protein